jgi:hypothetical protein
MDVHWKLVWTFRVHRLIEQFLVFFHSTGHDDPSYTMKIEIEKAENFTYKEKMLIITECID